MKLIYTSLKMEKKESQRMKISNNQKYLYVRFSFRKLNKFSRHLHLNMPIFRRQFGLLPDLKQHEHQEKGTNKRERGTKV